MKRLRPSRIRPMVGGAFASLFAAALLVVQIPFLERQRELFFDALTQAVAAPRSDDIVVVDIDRQSMLRSPDGNWGRAETAALIAALASAEAGPVAVDIVFSGDCEAADPANAALAKAMDGAPVILGFLIGNDAAGRPKPPPPVAVRRPISVPSPWFIDGTEASCPFLQAASRSAASAFLIGDDDARVRRAQAFSILGNDIYPAIGIEAARLASGGHAPVIGGEPIWLRLGERTIELENDGNLRFAAGLRETIAARTIAAGDIIDGAMSAERLKGKIVFIGSSLPNLGGLRPTASMPLEPSVQIHADIANAILTGFIPHRDRHMPFFEAMAAFAGGLLIASLATRLRPVASALVGTFAICAIVAAAAGIYATTALLIDAVSLGLAAAFVLIVTSVLQFTRVRRAEAAARSKFSQYLPQSVVDRYIDNPEEDRVAGEERPITALFTDIEGFSTLSQKLPPRDLVALLDIYYAEVNGMVAAHGGMVDKVVGDAVHAFFNAPEDLEDHVDKAIDCARAIHVLTEEMRGRPAFEQHQFGRTRIGIETGMAVVGEVGAGGKLDYTAHGDAINLAARLQEANKFLGTAICIGPEAAVQSNRQLRSLDMHAIRGFGEMELFTIEN